MKTLSSLIATSTIALTSVHAEDGAAEMAKKLQNPLANIHAIMTDNTIGFNSGNEGGVSYNFQLQPVYAIDFEDKGFTFIPRAVIPLLGIEPGTDYPILKADGTAQQNRWGLGDSILQTFIAPHTKSKIKWGVGPQFSIPTHTHNDLAGPGWGMGFAGIVTTDITTNISFAGIVGNHWSFDGEFSSMSLQPMFYYNVAAVPGLAIAYNATIAADWKAPSSDRWTVPLGITLSRTYDLGNGNGLEVSGGPYYNVARPDGASDWMFRFGVNFLLP